MKIKEKELRFKIREESYITMKTIATAKGLSLKAWILIALLKELRNEELLK